MERAVGFLSEELRVVEPSVAEERVFFVSAKEVLKQRLAESTGTSASGKWAYNILSNVQKVLFLMSKSWPFPNMSFVWGIVSDRLSIDFCWSSIAYFLMSSCYSSSIE